MTTAISLFPRIDVIIVTYNAQAFISDCLSSVDNQTVRENVRIIVLDNASSDATVATARRVLRPVDILIEMGANVGFGASSNVGIQLSDAPFVVLLNPDCILDDNSLFASLIGHVETEGVGMVSPLLRTADGEIDRACARRLPTLKSAADKLLPTWLAKRAPGTEAPYNFDYIPEGVDEFAVEAVNGAFMFARREAIDSVGLLDASFWMYAEDLDWCKRFGEAGWKIHLAPKLTATHLKGGSTGSYRSLKTNYWFHRSMMIYYQKHFSANRSGKVLVSGAIMIRFMAIAMRNAVARRVRLAHESAGSK